jgi:hypothetical protein
MGYAAPDTLRDYIRRGRLPARRIGHRGHFRVRLRDLESLFGPAVVRDSPNDAACDLPQAEVVRVVETAPPLTGDQLSRLSSLLGGRI